MATTPTQGLVGRTLPEPTWERFFGDQEYVDPCPGLADLPTPG